MFSIYNNKKVLVTGCTGFKGSWLIFWLKYLGANIVGLSLKPHTNPSLFDDAKLHKFIKIYYQDINDSDQVRKIILKEKPDFIFNLAAQAIVSESYKDPLYTLKTNIIGTANILDSLRFLDKDCVSIMITSDKCYENVEWLWGYKETDRLGGDDPYSGSKGSAELVVKSYFNSFFKDSENIKVTSVRAGNVIGGGDWSINRIVPDCIRSWSKGKDVNIRSPHSTRPWQHVLEPLSGYLTTGAKLFNNIELNGNSFNFGPNINQNKTVLDLVSLMSEKWEGSSFTFANKSNSFHESGLLKLNCEKAESLLNWKPTLNFEETINYTVEWYINYFKHNKNFIEFTEKQINDYTEKSNL